MALSDKEKIAIYERFLHDLQLNVQVICNEERVHELIDRACRWSYSHRVGNGELTEEEQDDMIETATKRLVE